MDSLLTQNAELPSAAPLSNYYKEPSELTAMRDVLETRLLRMESEIRSIVKASVSMKEVLERTEQHRNLMSVRLEGKDVCDIDEHSRYLQDVDSLIGARLQPISTALEDIKQQMSRPSMDFEHVPRPDELIVGHDEPIAVALVANREEIINGLDTEHVQLEQIDLPTFQESLRKLFREELQNHEVSVIQQFTELQNCGKLMMSHSPKGQSQDASVARSLAPVACMSIAHDKMTPEHNQRMAFSDPQATAQATIATRNASTSTLSQGYKDQIASRSQKPAPLKTSITFHAKLRSFRSTFDEWFNMYRGDSRPATDRDPMDAKISIRNETSFAGVFIQDRKLDKVSYCVEDFYKTTGWVQALVRSSCFQNFTGVVVCVNALWVGIAQDNNHCVKLYDSHPVFIIAETLFCSFFTMELAMRFITFTSARVAFRDGWFRFDFVLVVTMILDTWVIMVIVQAMDGKAVRIPVAPFRTLRLLKLTRMARLMHTFPELVTMIRSMFRAVRAVASMCILVTLLIYVWGIIMHALLKDEKELNERLFQQSQMDFSNMSNSMWILFMNGALLLDNSAPLLTQLVFGDSYTFKMAGAFFLVFVLLTTFLVLQMLTGIFCDVVVQVRKEQRNERDVRLIKQELTSMLNEIDDGDGKLTQAEVLRFINTDNTQTVLKQMGVNLVFLYEMQTTMFDKQQQIKIRDFLELMLVCRSSNQATVETLAGGVCSLSREIDRLQVQLTHGLDAMKAKNDFQDYAKRILTDD